MPEARLSPHPLPCTKQKIHTLLCIAGYLSLAVALANWQTGSRQGNPAMGMLTFPI